MTKPHANFGEFLMLFPGGMDLERDPSVTRDVDLLKVRLHSYRSLLPS